MTSMAVSPDHISETLARTMYEPTTGTERGEGALRGACAEIAHAIGPHEFRKGMVKLFLVHETMLRRTQAADHPALVAIDRWRDEFGSDPA